MYFIEDEWILLDPDQRTLQDEVIEETWRNRKRREAAKSEMPKRSRKVLPLSEKVKILDLIGKEKKSFVQVAKMYGKNESSIREIVKKEKEIRAAIAVTPHNAKVMATVRDKCLVKVEKALYLWMEDMNRKRVPIDSNVLRRKALSLYEDFSEGFPETSYTKPFIASKGWLFRFRNRFGLRNKNITGESVSADEEAVATFPLELKELIKEKGYDPKQVFCCDETRLFWKKMPKRGYIHKGTKQIIPEYKAWKDRLTLRLCGNAAGHMIKPGVIHRAKNPYTLKNENKHYLPVFWQQNQKAWMTAILFMEWFHQCYIPEVKIYLEQEGLPFKVLLIIDNAPGHPQSICYEDENVEVVFLPPNTTTLLQPLEQGIIRCFKATYTRLVLDRIRSAIDSDSDLDIMQYWKSYTIADAATLIRTATDELKPATVNACWSNLWREVVKDFKGFAEIDGEIRKLIDVARQVGGEGFVDMLDEEVKELIEGHQEVLTNEELEELVKSSTEEEEEETEEEPSTWTLEQYTEVFRIAQTLKEKVMEYDPRKERSIQVTCMITKALQPLQQDFDELKRKKQHFPITRLYPKVLANTSSIIEDPQTSVSSHDFQPSTSSLINEPGSLETNDPSDVSSDGQ